MAVIRLFLLLVVLGGLTLLLAQNWSPVLPLVFLGMRTPALPLALWILFSIGAGAVTSLLITSLFKLSSYFAGTQRQSRPKPASRPPRYSAPRSVDTPSAASPRVESSYSYTPPSSPPPAATTTAANNSTADDDWETDASTSDDDDWDFDEEPKKPAPTPPPPQVEIRDSRNYERSQEPKSGSKSGSVYSYSYREPKDSGVGKTESVYDADYRVIVPPYQAPTTNQTNDDDDWEFFEDDDEFEDDDQRPRR